MARELEISYLVILMVWIYKSSTGIESKTVYPITVTHSMIYRDLYHL